MAVWVRKVDVRLPGKGHSNSHGARPVHLIITMIKWIRTSRLSITNFLWQSGALADDRALILELLAMLHVLHKVFFFFITLKPRVE